MPDTKPRWTTRSGISRWLRRSAAEASDLGSGSAAWRSRGRRALAGGRLLTLVIVGLMVIAAVMVLRIVAIDPVRSPRTVQIATANWAPYVDPGAPEGGPLSAVVTHVLESAGFDAQIKFLTFDDALDSLRSREMFAAYPYISGSDRRRDFRVSDPIMEFRYVTEYNQNRFDPKQWGSVQMRGVRVGTVRGYNYWDGFTSAVADAEIIEFDNADELFEALAAPTGSSGVHVDVAPEGEHQIRDLLSAVEADTSALRRLDAPTATSPWQPLHILLHKSIAAKDLDRINDAIATFRRSAEYRRLVLDATDTAEPGIIETRDSGAVEVMFGDEVRYTPNGTQIEVLQWQGDSKRRDDAVSVKILSGPLQGRIGSVELREVRLR